MNCKGQASKIHCSRKKDWNSILQTPYKRYRATHEYTKQKNTNAGHRRLALSYCEPKLSTHYVPKKRPDLLMRLSCGTWTFDSKWSFLYLGFTPSLCGPPTSP